MVFQTIYSLAWISVILIQAFIHFVVGPRYRKNDGADDNEIATFLESDLGDANSHDSVVNRSSSQLSQYITDDDRSAESSYRPSFEYVDELDERDSIDDVVPNIQNTADRAQPPSSLKNDGDVPDGHNRRVSTHEGKKSNKEDEDRDLTRTVSEPENFQRFATDQDDQIVDEDDCIDDDEQWRYELVKEYYATSFQTINHIISKSIAHSESSGESHYDPALQPTVGTINALSRKLNQQRDLTTLNFPKANNHTKTKVTFDQPSALLVQ